MLDLYDDLFRTVAQSEAISEPWVLKGIAVAESGLNWMAYRQEPKFYARYIRNNPGWTGHRFYDSPQIIAASWGLMQVMYTTASEVGWPREFDWWELLIPKNNVTVGARILSEKLGRWGNLSSAVSAYNAGVARVGKDGHYQNQAYVDKVMRISERVREEWALAI